jgi:GAF domain-containing protein
MIGPPVPADEEERLALLRSCNIIYTPAEQAFDDVARLAADLCGTEIALITLVDSDHQWFKARVGVEQTGTPRDLSFCGHCINHRHALVVDDTHADKRFLDNPLVTGDPHIRFYAGVPLLLDEGSAIGALSVADRAPRTLTQRQIESLERLAKQIAREIGLRRDVARVQEKAVHSATSRLSPGVVIAGRWQVRRELGRGGTGAVFEAIGDRGERVAIKVLHPMWAGNDEVVERFAREARVLMRLRSPHVGKLLDVGNLDTELGSLPYLALEYLEGQDLDRVLEAKGRLPFRQAFTWCADACDGLTEAHDLGVIHRDLKPSSLFLAGPPSADPIVKVLDFGIALGDPEGRGSRLTDLGAVVGSPSYMSPEQMMAASDVDARSDVWSMGAILYELVTGQVAFGGDGHFQIFANVMTKPPQPIEEVESTVPEPARRVVLRCLEKSREARFESMAVLGAALRDAASASPNRRTAGA